MMTDQPATESRRLGWLALGGIAGALATSSCCLLPLLLFVLGIGGSWVGNLTALAPYQPLFLAITAVVLALGFRRVHRQPSCADGNCERPLPHRIVKAGLWLAVALIIAAVAFPYAAPLLLGS